MDFYGRSVVQLDGVGRIRLPAWAQDAFASSGGGELVCVLMPEGCLGLFPAATWQRCRQEGAVSLGDVLNDEALRCRLRYAGSMSQYMELGSQGRIALPQNLREDAGLADCAEAMLVGAEKWCELWHPCLWEAELAKLLRR